MQPRVLISDALSPAAVAIFEDLPSPSYFATSNDFAFKAEFQPVL